MGSGDRNLRRFDRDASSRRCGDGERRPHPADDRPLGEHRQAGTRRRRALYPAARRRRRRQEDLADRQGRHRSRRRHQAPRGGTDRQRSRQNPDGLRPDAARAGGGAIAQQIRVPLKNPDFAPFLQRAKDDAPDAVFVFVPSGFGAVFMKEFVEQGLDKSGIKLIGTGDVTDDDLLPQMGDAALGVVTTHNYSAAHDSPENKAFVAAFEKANGGMRPNFMAVGAYDGMALIYQALEKTKGATDGDALIAAMKGASWTSPRGPISIDPETRDIVQTIYVRKVEKVDGQLYNVEFGSTPAVKDPYKASKK